MSTTDRDGQRIETKDDEVVAHRMVDWRRRLIDLSYRNRLIKYRPLRASSLAIVQPSIDVLLADIGRSAPWNFYFPPDPDDRPDEETTETEALLDQAVVKAALKDRPPARDEIVLTERHPSRINRTLENLARKSNAEFQDKALRILYLAAGFLDWVDPARGEQLTSPLVLVPVRLQRKAAAQPYQLFFVDDEETVINPSLIEKLRHDANLELPEDFLWEDKPILTELAEIEEAVSGHGWSVRHDAVLGLFSFQKYVMYRDLLDNEPVITRHPIVRSLAVGRLLGDPTTEVDVPAVEHLDEEQPAAQTYSVLDADASQRRCIEAAKRGQSFVMHGPPGTGKSQTIANVIAEAISQGKKVLFVSEKAAALDVVHNRLRERGMADYCLMLHGEHASRREVVSALHSSLTSELVPRLAFDAEEAGRLDRLCQYLNNQVETLHSPEALLGDRSIRDVYAQLATLHAAVAVPGAPPASEISGAGVIEEYQQLSDLFARIAERWHVSPPDYVWRDFDAVRFSSDDRARVLHAVDAVKQHNVLLRQAAEIAAAQLGWPEPHTVADVESLISLGEHLEQAPSVAAHWLQPDMPSMMRTATEQARDAYARQAAGQQHLQSLYAVRRLDYFRDDLADVLDRTLRAVREAAGQTARWSAELLPELPQILARLEDLPRRCEATRRRVAELADLLGQPDRDASAGRAAELVDLARLAFEAATRPQPDWLVKAGLERAETTIAELGPLLEDYQRRRDELLREWRTEALALDARPLADSAAATRERRRRLLELWEPAGLELDVRDLSERWQSSEAAGTRLLTSWKPEALTSSTLDELTERFRTYMSALSRLKGSYRRDAKELKELRLDGRLPEQAVEALDELLAYRTERADLAAAIGGVRRDRRLPDDVPRALGAIAELQSSERELAGVVAPLRRDAAVPDQVVEQLLAIADLEDIGQRIDHQAARGADALGSYWAGRDTDVQQIRAACQTAARALPLRSPDTAMDVLAGQLCVGARPDTRLAQAADQLESAMSSLERETQALAPFIANASLSPRDSAVADIGRAVEHVRPAFENFGAIARDVNDGAITPATDLDELVARAGVISELHRTQTSISSQEREWATTLGAEFAGAATDWARVTVAADWIEQLFEQVDPISPQISEQLLSAERRWPDTGALKRLLDRYVAASEDLADFFAARRRTTLINVVRDEPLAAGDELCAALLANVDSLYDWTDLRMFRERALEAGWDELVSHLVAAEVSSDDVVPAFQRAYWSRRLEALFEEEPELEADLRGGSYQRFISEYQELDRKLVHTGPDRLIAHRNASMPQHVAVAGSEVAVLRTEAGKLRRHKPVRRLLAEIPSLLSELKPCLMMSPLSVSHYLTTEHTFDLVLFDEASQVPPQDAINCIYRGRQLVVAGDAKQLPPTAFFQIAELDEADDEQIDAQEDMESVLDACQALLPEYYLRWHYRSRHEDLIVFSNDEIYNGELVTFPTPDHLSSEMGVAFTLVPDGVYDRGKSQTNRVEARAVAQRVVDYLTDGTGRSVGVIAFNLAQATAIANELDLLRLERLELEHHFGGDRLDAPFVKHLESVQGDERDVIIFSVGYGRDADGRFPMSFGPLNKAGGHRRLNVAITRARQKIEIVASVTSKDFTLSERASQGARLLRDYLAFAERAGSQADLDDLGDEEHFAVTGIEREIAREIERLGLRVVHQVGAGFIRVDIGVIDPDNPHSFLLGVESDGPAYRKTPTTRDRERLREEVLRQLGWRIHRVWSVDWVRDRSSEMERLRDAIESARASGGRADVSVAPASRVVSDPMRVERPVVDLRAPETIDSLPWVTPYVREEVAFQRTGWEFHEPRNRSVQTAIAARILETEAPVHIEYLVQRLAEAFGLQRVGHRVDAAARQAISQATRAHGFVRRGDFLWRDGQELTVVRRPVDGDPRTRREITRIPAKEIELAFRRLLEASPGAPDDDLLVSAARVLGFDRMGERVRAVLKRRLRAVRRGDA